MNFDYKSWDIGKTFFLFLKIFISALIFSIVAYFISVKLPSADQILPASRLEPIQDNNAKGKFASVVKDLVYELTPRASYKISGLVVSLHDSEFMDMTHAKAKDFINTHDLCVIWGDNAINPFLQDMKFTHGDWTCYFETKSEDAWKSFRKDQLSNNHILPANAKIEELISSVRVGDQITLEGKLVDYTLPGGGSRNTSLVRDDIEDGACEVLYVTQAQIISRGSALWYPLRRLGEVIAVLSLLGMLVTLFVLPKLQK